MADQAVTVIGLDEARKYLSEIPAEWFDESKAVIRESVTRVHRTLTGRVQNGVGNTLHSRTGQLRRSLQMRVYGDSLKLLGGKVVSDGSVAPYNVVHEHGATIRAKNAYGKVPGGPYLNIPLDANKTPAGVMRQSAREVFSAGGYLTQARSGKWLVFSAAGRPMFVLVKEVTIPARLKMIETGEDEVPTLLSELSKATGRAIGA